MKRHSFAEALHAAGPNTEREDKLKLYAWLVGDWAFDITTILEDGATHSGRGEIHASSKPERRHDALDVFADHARIIPLDGGAFGE
jgi:hypothetical protein